MYDFTNTVILITGSARGIGFTLARHFAKANATVIVLDINNDAVQKAVDDLNTIGGKAFGYTGNVTDSAGIEELFAQIVQEHGKIDVLINNAGVTRDNLMIRMTEEEWQLVMDINLKGSFICTQKVFKHMMKARQGSIINMASVIGLMGNSGQANYAASKGGLIAFTKSCAKEFARRNIRVNAVAPGFIETEMTASLSDEIRASYATAIPLGRMGSPDDIAKICMFLASEDSSYITGQTIAVDGGLTMH
ncbi:MAG: 3-oxoacyl-[acyl-carrier-protein] reductase [Candidatus Cloacimonetes bacterium]|jgi:3-oxoacyl-[acyl-carrier protein] reductase|nr:3-oxoacyl-[acyl-carrier-protein] reductase [Candidatus Cloacimonadota bacterium]MDD2506242.1 3-oxoacyl-[acyl-carrier-protein] reductase [Candidatus Cloacimonadota bacterium]MDD4147991.1 3-oxoacyl-[acyl-carrier-protein] reductase [Candidatus Cloacimonadota bacterium]MDD4559295.1 3-oxoacyl-[acyl-carrier-protein] reductase [Candidatus Cloacimonadota bacterium]